MRSFCLFLLRESKKIINIGENSQVHMDIMELMYVCNIVHEEHPSDVIISWKLLKLTYLGSKGFKQSLVIK